MIAVIQRVSAASVSVNGAIVGHIGPGLAVLAAVHADDSPADAQWLAGKLLTLRIFPNADKNFDLDVQAAHGSLLVISNFTVAAETAKGRRPSLNPAAGPDLGRQLFDLLLDTLRQSPVPLATGAFGADMLVSLENTGPATFLLDSRTIRP
ncbi:MAG TPA: D-aminoacyl-tRNA deacylase [Phycisphaerae bacterium]|nr:D-aminoacyl-tRNA deacylase [Phycisphaerae bacterium]